MRCASYAACQYSRHAAYRFRMQSNKEKTLHMMARLRNKSTLRLSLLLLGCMLAHTASVHAQSPTQHYPPYPDMWQWVIPQAYEHDSIVNLYALPTGEYVISSTWWEPLDRPLLE